VWLVGMMGAGKTSVGRALAARLGCSFVDTDAEVERRAGRRIAEIFAADGEAGFRERERDAVNACAGRGVVVALGGGALAQPEVRRRVQQDGTIVYLCARPETLLSRVGSADERPLLAGLEPWERLERVRQLLQEREPVYQTAELCVETDGASVEDVVERIVARLAEQPAGRGSEAAP
jgi:shikimate kinase